MTGLRERKKAQTRRAISEAAIVLFLERGYDAVSVAEVAAAADVSKRTLFAYFPSKDELVLHRFADHEQETAQVVRGRPEGERSLVALRAHLLAALARHDPITGLCDVPAVVRFTRLVMETPALAAAVMRYHARGVAALAAALHETAGMTELPARLAAGQIQSTLHALAEANQLRITQGSSAAELAPTAVAEAELAFELLETGLAERVG